MPQKNEGKRDGSVWGGGAFWQEVRRGLRKFAFDSEFENGFPVKRVLHNRPARGGIGGNWRLEFSKKILPARFHEGGSDGFPSAPENLVNPVLPANTGKGCSPAHFYSDSPAFHTQAMRLTAAPKRAPNTAIFIVVYAPGQHRKVAEKFLWATGGAKTECDH